MKIRIAVLIIAIALLFSSVSVGNVIAFENSHNFIEAEKAVLSAWDDLKDSADISEFNIKIYEYYDFCDYVYNRNAEYFYVYFSGYSYNREDIITKVSFKYSIDKSEIVQKKSIFNKKSNEVLNLIPENISNEEKLLILHDYIASTTEYDKNVYTDINYDDGYIRTSYGCIVNKKAVCEGISKAFSYFCKRLGIKSYFVTSEAMHHQWNMVELRGKYYHIDITQDLIVYSLDQYKHEYYQAVGNISHKFFLKSDEQIQDKALGENRHYDWVAPYAANDSDTYKNAFWNYAKGIVNYKNGKYYYVKDADFVQYDYVNKTIKKLYSIPNTYWECTYGKRHLYKGEYSKSVIDTNKNYAYFIVCNNIYSYNLNNGEISIAYSRYGKGFIYSLVYTNGKLRISVRDDRKNDSNNPKSYYTDLTVPVLLPDDDVLIGDVDDNGKVDIQDTLCLFKYNLKRLDEINYRNSDVNLDSKVDLKDTLFLRRIIANKQV